MQRRVDLLGLRVQELALGLPGHEIDLGEHLALVRIGEAFDVDFGMGEEHLLLLRRGRIDQHDRLLVAADVRRSVKQLIVEGEEERAE